MTPKPPNVSKNVKDMHLPDNMFQKEKPIRYFEVVKHYKWGCPKCDYLSFTWRVFWLHYKETHGTPPWEYQTPTDNYVLRELK
mgnify:CR=1 FL=1